MNDLRLACRRLAAAPAFTIAAVLTLALGIGANTLAFSALRGMLVKPLPFAQAEPHRLDFGASRPRPAPPASR